MTLKLPYPASFFQHEHCLNTWCARASVILSHSLSSAPLNVHAARRAPMHHWRIGRRCAAWKFVVVAERRLASAAAATTAPCCLGSEGSPPHRRAARSVLKQRLRVEKRVGL